jgi:hypothetical protein
LLIAQAGIHINHSQLSLPEYHKIYIAQKNKLLRSYITMQCPNDCRSPTFERYWERGLISPNPEEPDLFGLLVFEHLTGFTRSERIQSRIDVDPQVGSIDNIITHLNPYRLIDSAISNLLGVILPRISRPSFSLRPVDSDVWLELGPSPLVQSYYWNSPPVIPAWACVAASNMLATSPGILILLARVASDFRQAQSLISWVDDAIIQETESNGMIIAEFARMYDQCGWWSQAQVLWTQAVERSQQTLGEEHFNTLSSMASLSVARLRLGMLAEAEALQC